MWFHGTAFLGYVAATALVRALPYEPNREPMDLVDIMEHEATAKGIPLTKDYTLNPHLAGHGSGSGAMTLMLDST